MVERGLYYATTDLAKMIKYNGGTWNDTKHRPSSVLSNQKKMTGYIGPSLWEN